MYSRPGEPEWRAGRKVVEWETQIEILGVGKGPGEGVNRGSKAES